MRMEKEFTQYIFKAIISSFLQLILFGMIENKPKKLDMTKDEYRFLKTEAKSWFDAESHTLAEINKSSQVSKKRKSKSGKK
jgi:hypothetical protein